MDWQTARHIQCAALDAGFDHVNIIQPVRDSWFGKTYVGGRSESNGHCQLEMNIRDPDEFEAIPPEVVTLVADEGCGFVRTRPGRYQTTPNGEPVGDPEMEAPPEVTE